MSQTIREFIEENNITAKLVLSNPGEKDKNGKALEVFIDEDSLPTLLEEKAMVYEAQDLEELIEHGETLANIFDNVHAVFYAKDGGNMEGWISEDELDFEIPEDHFLMELV